MANKTLQEAAAALKAILPRREGDADSFRVGTVDHIDEHGTAWVTLAGDAQPSPCTAEVGSRRGDTVTVRVTATGRAYLSENVTDPAANVSAVGDAVTMADEARQVALAVNQHFWDDQNGAHVTDMVQDEWLEGEAEDFPDLSDDRPYHNLLMNSLGILLRRAHDNLVSITRSAVAFYDGDGNEQENVVASFGKGGAVLGRDAEPHVGVTKDEVAFYDGEGELERNKVSRISANETRFGRVTDMHAQTGDSGFHVLNGTDEFLKVEGIVSGQPIEAQDYGGETVSVHALEHGDRSGDMMAYHVFGAYTLEPGQGIAEAAQIWHDAGNEDDVNVVTMEPAWVWVDTPLGEPNPDLWVLADGELSGMYLEISDAARTLSAFAGHSVAFGADEELVPPDGEPMAWYERLTGDEYGDVTEGAATRTYFKLGCSEDSLGAHVVIASAYRARDGKAEIGNADEGHVTIREDGMRVYEGSKMAVSMRKSGLRVFGADGSDVVKIGMAYERAEEQAFALSDPIPATLTVVLSSSVREGGYVTAVRYLDGNMHPMSDDSDPWTTLDPSMYEWHENSSNVVVDASFVTSAEDFGEEVTLRVYYDSDDDTSGSPTVIDYQSGKFTVRDEAGKCYVRVAGDVVASYGGKTVSLLDHSDGTSDYSELTNKPSIEGVTLQGDKSFPDLGIFIEPEEPYPQSDDYALTTQEITALWNIVQGGANG